VLRPAADEVQHRTEAIKEFGSILVGRSAVCGPCSSSRFGRGRFGAFAAFMSLYLAMDLRNIWKIKRAAAQDAEFLKKRM
jgi:hypothetical protein